MHKYHLEYEEKGLGQLFSKTKSQSILKILLAKCDAAGVEIITECSIKGVKQTEDTQNSRFQLATSGGAFTCQSLVMQRAGFQYQPWAQRVLATTRLNNSALE